MENAQRFAALCRRISRASVAAARFHESLWPRQSIRRLERIVVLTLAAIQAAGTAFDFLGRKPLRVVNGLGVAAAARFSFHGSSIA